MNLFCEEVHKLEAEFKQCRKPLKKVVEEIVERKNGDRMQRNMPYFVRLVVDYFYDRMRKTKNSFAPSNTGVATLKPKAFAARLKWISRTCPILIREGTPRGFSTISKGRPLGR